MQKIAVMRVLFHMFLFLSGQILQNLGSIGIGLHLGHYLLNEPILINNESGPYNAHAYLAVQLLLLPHAVRLNGLKLRASVTVRQERRRLQ